MSDSIWRDGIEFKEFPGNEIECAAKLRELGWRGVYQHTANINFYKIDRVGTTPPRIIGMTVFWGNYSERKHRHYIRV